MTSGNPLPIDARVQHAYLTGPHAGADTLGGVGCHLYQEFGEGHCLTASQLEQAITTSAATPPGAAYRLSPRRAAGLGYRRTLLERRHRS